MVMILAPISEKERQKAENEIIEETPETGSSS